MSHFTVLVVGNDIDDQLFPFCERTEDLPQELLEYKVYVAKGEYGDWKRYSFKTPEEAIKELGEELVEEYGYWNNPNAKWDWYSIGGRWSPYFKLKETEIGVAAVGRSGSGGYNTKDLEKLASGLWGDSARKCDIDFEGMRDVAGEEAGTKWDEIEDIIGDIKANHVTWEAIRGKYTKEEVQSARDEYNKQEAYVRLRKAEKYFVDVEDFLCTREEYVERARSQATAVFAVLKDGKWYEKGQMGWWGMVANEKDQGEWNKQIWELIEALPDDTQLTVVDCHI